MEASVENALSEGRILVVEDNIVNREVAHAMLKKMGFKVDFAEDGTEAIEKVAAEDKYSLIFMDCQMPGLDGFEATRRIKDIMRQDKSKAAPIIALTAYAMDADRAKCTEAGMDDYIAKPVRMTDFGRVADAWLNHASKKNFVEKPAIIALKEIMGDSFPRMISLYITNTAEAIGKIESGLLKGDLDQAVTNAHSMKSPSMQVGETEVSLLASEIEREAKSGRKERSKLLLWQLKLEFAKAQNNLKVYIT